MNQPLIPKVSVIVPVYKVEAYLQECIDSILAQTFTDFELILVNDGSPDNCGAICDQNAARDSRIRVIHQENQGVTRARANGVAAAKGEFINFVDGDDTLPPHSLTTLAAYADESTDVVLGKHQRIYSPPRGDISPAQYREICATLKNISGGPVAKLYRRSLFSEKVFDIPADICMGEDAIMNIRLAYNVKGKVYSTAEVVYDYRLNPGSVMHTYHPLAEAVAFQKYRLLSIPEEDIDRFLPRGLAKNLLDHWFAETSWRICLAKETRNYHRYLISIKKKHTDFSFGLLGGILFHCTNPIIRAIVITLRKMAHAFMKK